MTPSPTNPGTRGEFVDVDETTRVTLRPWHESLRDGYWRFGIEHADEDDAGNIEWRDNPDGSWAYLTPEVAAQIVALLAVAVPTEMVPHLAIALNEHVVDDEWRGFVRYHWGDLELDDGL